MTARVQRQWRFGPAGSPGPRGQVSRGGSHRSPGPSPGAVGPPAGPDVLDERVVDDGPVGAVVRRGLGYASLLLGNRTAQLGPKPCRQPRASRTAGSDSV